MSQEMGIGLVEPIFTHKSISMDLWDKDIHTTRDGRKILWQLFIFMEIEPFL